MLRVSTYNKEQKQSDRLTDECKATFYMCNFVGSVL